MALGDEHNGFDLVVSLGSVCQVAHQIERYFGTRRTSPFDWLVTPLWSLAKVFSNDGVLFGENLTVERDGSVVVCENYGVAHQHDFPRNGYRRAIISGEAIANLKGKYLSKYDKLSRSLQSGKKVLFVRLGGHHDTRLADQYASDDRLTKAEDLNWVCKMLGEKFPGIQFELAFVYIKGVTPLSVSEGELDPRVRVFELNHGGENWMGNDVEWNKVFSTYNYTEEARHKADVAPVEILHT